MKCKEFKLNPQFRQLTDLLFYSDRMDLDLSNFSFLLQENIEHNLEYLWDRFEKSSQIFWENGKDFWNNRLSFLFNLELPKLNLKISNFLEQKIMNYIHYNNNINIKYSIELQQFIEYCNIKNKRNEPLISFKEFLIKAPDYISCNKLLHIIEYFIPCIFSSVQDYIDNICIHSPRNFDFLKQFELNGVIINKTSLAKIAKELLYERSFNDKNRRSFFSLLKDRDIFNYLKNNYQINHKDRLLSLLQTCHYSEFENSHFINIKNILELDPTIADQVAAIYANKVYVRTSVHKKANVDKLIRLLNKFPIISKKSILRFLSSNKKSDIKYLQTAFPELKKWTSFI